MGCGRELVSPGGEMYELCLQPDDMMYIFFRVHFYVHFLLSILAFFFSAYPKLRICIFYFRVFFIFFVLIFSFFPISYFFLSFFYIRAFYFSPLHISFHSITAFFPSIFRHHLSFFFFHSQDRLIHLVLKFFFLRLSASKFVFLFLHFYLCHFFFFYFFSMFFFLFLF